MIPRQVRVSDIVSADERERFIEYARRRYAEECYAAGNRTGKGEAAMDATWIKSPDGLAGEKVMGG